MFKISFKKSVARDLKKISKSQTKHILDKIEADLTKSADKIPQLKGKFSGLRKYRIGDYRIIFTIINNDTVLITRIQHRKDVYR